MIFVFLVPASKNLAPAGEHWHREETPLKREYPIRPTAATVAAKNNRFIEGLILEALEEIDNLDLRRG